jgi:hypothetical protein
MKKQAIGTMKSAKQAGFTAVEVAAVIAIIMPPVVWFAFLGR